MTLEYLLLFAAVAVAVIVGLRTFGAEIRQALTGFMDAAAKAISN